MNDNPDRASKSAAAQSTPSNHRDFFAKLYGSLEEEYNKKRELEDQQKTSRNNGINALESNKDKSKNDIFKNKKIEYINEDDGESDVERNDSKDCNLSSSPALSEGSSPTKDEEISPPRVPPPTLKQLQKRFEVTIKLNRTING